MWIGVKYTFSDYVCFAWRNFQLPTEGVSREFLKGNRSQQIITRRIVLSDQIWQNPSASDEHFSVTVINELVMSALPLRYNSKYASTRSMVCVDAVDVCISAHVPGPRFKMRADLSLLEGGYSH